MVEAGDISMTITFEGPVAVAYPQLRPDVTSYDESDRNYEEKENLKLKDKKSLLNDLLPPKQIKDNENYNKMITDHPEEFSEAEIVAAFKFIDLDHNNFVGAKEIRHILVCMGELITDEEVDMMISMVDLG